MRGLQACKFLLAARFLGPEQVGLVGIALICLAIAEGMSDTGLSQAVVQNKRSLNRWQAGAVWTLQLSRGLVIALGLFLLSTPIAWAFGATSATGLVALAGIVALLRNSLNPGLFVAQRNRNFRKLSIYEVSAAVVDITTTLLLIRAGMGPASVLLGSVAGESSKLLMTWSWFRVSIKPTVQWRLIAPFTSFGKWIWGSSVITLVLNQLDKILVAKLLGTTEFGFYQVASRVAQLVVADASVALGQYLYPTLSHRHRMSKSDAKSYFARVLLFIVPVLIVVSGLLMIFAPWLIATFIGQKWQSAVSILRVLSLAMLFGGVIALLVSYARAVGQPQIVTRAAAFQLAALALLAPILIWKFGAIGMAWATTGALFVSVIYLALRTKAHVS